ncbi:uncharacterized protein LOC126885027 [Diabrotica virgifera virgifera]|uniref:Uncharacterized protein n=1 Tax=Diabrotica virgifera virgifera TaxID=50390 RepID=A0ABM5KB37_DIAVI|nr:uncharacterized protein LOC126885027 [Diabrotica virgifera virgifera]
MCVLLYIEVYAIVAGLLLYNKYRTFNVFIHYVTIAVLIQPGCAGMLLSIIYLSKVERMLDNINENTKNLPPQDVFFENAVRREAINIKIISFTVIIYSLVVHLIFSFPSVFNDYDLNILYWLATEYFGAHVTIVMIWISRACIAIGNF